MSIFIQSPKGIAPRLNPRFLQDNQAQQAKNCVLESGDVRPMKAPEQIQSLDADTLAVFRIGGSWQEFSTRAEAMASPVQAENNRYYYTLGTGGGKKADDSTGPLDLGVPKPDAGPSLTINGEEDGNVLRSSAYVYTRVTAWGEESAASKPSGLIDVEEGQYVTFSGLDDGSDSHVTHFRLYRAVGGAQSSVWMLVPYQTTAGELKYDDDNQIIYDIPKSGVSSMEDGLRDESLNITIETENWYEPPSDLHGLHDFSNGLVGGLSGKKVCFAEPWHPYAWPTAYRYQLDEDGVGLGDIQGIPVAFTARGVHLFDGSTPDSFQQRKISESYGCESATSIVSTPQGVFFASRDGLCLATHNGVEVLSRQIWTKEQWQALGPESLLGFFYDQSYYGFFLDSSQGFMLRFGDAVVTTFELSDTIKGGYVLPAQGLYVILDTGTSRELRKFDSGSSNLDFTWTSKIFRRPWLGYACLKIMGEQDGSATVTIKTDGTTVFSQNVDYNQAVRLPVGTKGQEQEITLQGGARFSALAMTGTMEEIKQHGI